MVALDRCLTKAGLGFVRDVLPTLNFRWFVLHVVPTHVGSAAAAKHFEISNDIYIYIHYVLYSRCSMSDCVFVFFERVGRQFDRGLDDAMFKRAF